MGGLAAVVVMLLGHLVFQYLCWRTCKVNLIVTLFTRYVCAKGKLVYTTQHFNFSQRDFRDREVAPERNLGHSVPPIEPTYLEPKPAPAQSSPHACRTNSSSDHMYEEIDEALLEGGRKKVVTCVTVDVLTNPNRSSYEQ